MIEYHLPLANHEYRPHQAYTGVQCPMGCRHTQAERARFLRHGWHPAAEAACASLVGWLPIRMRAVLNTFDRPCGLGVRTRACPNPLSQAVRRPGRYSCTGTSPSASLLPLATSVQITDLSLANCTWMTITHYRCLSTASARITSASRMVGSHSRLMLLPN
jgi:hypothetical protein